MRDIIATLEWKDSKARFVLEPSKELDACTHNQRQIHQDFSEFSTRIPFSKNSLSDAPYPTLKYTYLS